VAERSVSAISKYVNEVNAGAFPGKELVSFLLELGKLRSTAGC